MKGNKLIIIFIFFLIGGIICGYSFDFIQNDKALTLTFKWLTIPSLFLSVFYGYKMSFGFNNKIPIWKNTLQLMLSVAIFGLMFLKSFQGYLVFYNAFLGEQEKYHLKGHVIELRSPKNKKLLNNFSIVIRTDNNEIINLDVPTNEYRIGQAFEKEMIKGSLGILYSRK